MSEPIVSLSEIIKYNPAPVSRPGGQYDRGTGVGLRRHPGTVEGVGDEECCHHEHNSRRYLNTNIKQSSK